jgi:hypothetical protein
VALVAALHRASAMDVFGTVRARKRRSAPHRRPTRCCGSFGSCRNTRAGQWLGRPVTGWSPLLLRKLTHSQSISAGWLAFTGRASNPLDRYKRFQIKVSSSFSGLSLAQGKFHNHRGPLYRPQSSIAYPCAARALFRGVARTALAIGRDCRARQRRSGFITPRRYNPHWTERLRRSWCSCSGTATS